MSEEQVSGGGVDSDSGPICQWCSAALPSDQEERCPSCGAALHEAAPTEVPGVTQIDHEALLKGRPTTQKTRGLIGWLSGEYEAEGESANPGTLEPPDEAVRREMLRLELAALEAEVLARQAEVVAEVATETGEPVHLEDLRLDTGLDAATNGDVDAAQVEAEIEAAATSAEAETDGAEAETDEATADADAPAPADEALEESRGA